MRRTLGAVVMLLIGIGCGYAVAQSSATAASGKMDRLLVYGKDFAFGVKEPEGWRGDTGEIADKYQVNIVFVPAAISSDTKNVSIRVRVNDKVDENTIEDLNYDMEQYRKEYPKALFGALSVFHPDYKAFAKLVYLPGQFYEYVAYVNPGPQSKFTLSAAMSTGPTQATPEELKAFKTVLQSLVWFSNTKLAK